MLRAIWDFLVSVFGGNLALYKLRSTNRHISLGALIICDIVKGRVVKLDSLFVTLEGLEEYEGSAISIPIGKLVFGPVGVFEPVSEEEEYERLTSELDQKVQCVEHIGKSLAELGVKLKRDPEKCFIIGRGIDIPNKEDLNALLDRIEMLKNRKQVLMNRLGRM